MGVLRAHGIEVDVPPGFEGRIRIRPSESAPAEIRTATTASTARAGRTFPVLNLANFPLPGEIGDYGGGATELMGPPDILLNLAEFGPDSVATPLFAPVERLPVLQTGDFDPQRMQRTLPGQSGAQRFFTIAGRAFCLYVVLGSHRRRWRTLPVVRELVDSIRIV